jgi:ParB-like chromosome segregation protein Spo0J
MAEPIHHARSSVPAPWASRVHHDAASPVEPDVVQVPIDSLRIGPVWRVDGPSTEHVRVLAELDGRWPPLLVRQDTLEIVDGVHRYHAARRLRHEHVACVFFDGDAEDAFLEFVRRNVRHGLALSLRDRERAAARLLKAREDWADRRIADFCALAPGTVARLRRRMRSTVQDAQSISREGRDGRVRPVDASALRRSIVLALEASPDASLRQIARQVGSSPATVHAVRSKLARGVPVLAEADAPGAAPEPGAVGPPAWTSDAALTATPSHVEFAEWFARTEVDERCVGLVGAPPLSRVYELADEARRRARCWALFADAIEERARRSR